MVILRSSGVGSRKLATRLDRGYDALMAERVMEERGLSGKGVSFCALCAGCGLAGFGRACGDVLCVVRYPT
jgi:hypothetical protein